MSPLSVAAVRGVGEVRAGDDLAALLVAATDLRDGDVLVVTSKAVSKAEGRVVADDRESAVRAETAHVVARRGRTTIARTRHGLVMAAAGVDASNTEPGTVVLLPLDPDGSARALRRRLRELTSANVAVVVSDTSGRAWRAGQTDVAVGAAGLAVLDDHAGRADPYGNLLAVTAPAVADEVAGAADLVTGKTSGCPAAVVRGLEDRVLPPEDDGPGARALVRDESQDMFALGSREAVVAAARAALAGPEGPDRDGAPPPGFGAPAPAEELLAALAAAGLGATVRAGPSVGAGPAVLVGGEPADRTATLVEVVALAHGWVPVHDAAGRLAALRRDEPAGGAPPGR